MAQCLWRAYSECLTYLDMDFRYARFVEDWHTYRRYKCIGQQDIDKPTWGGIVPWIVWELASRNDLDTAVEHDIWTPEHYLANATPVQAKIINFSNFGSRGITLAPAIYCDLDTQHALFAEEIPDGNIVLAIQLSKWEDKNG